MTKLATLLYLVGAGAFLLGFLLCALFTMGRIADGGRR